ncbi:MAG: hypothetical protein FWF44_01585 [Defluviitaleaceae bacterium]|nr:hypothetical protein [Defluviitaleaceae bacterium]
MIISEKSRELYRELANGWNTWDLNSLTAHVYLPDKVRVGLGFLIPGLNYLVSDVLWDHAENFGEHAADGSYTELDVRIREGVCRVETASHGTELLIRVTPVVPEPDGYVFIETGEMFSRKTAVSYADGGILLDNGANKFAVRSLSEGAEPEWDAVTAHHLAAKLDGTVYFTVNSGKTAGEIDQALLDSRRRWLENSVKAEGALGRGLCAMKRALLWNMVYDFMNGRVITPVSRNWCQRNGHFGDYVLFDWDTFFAGLQYGLIDKRLAYSSVFSILEEQTEEGMIPNFGSGAFISRDRSEPQVGALCVWKLYVQFGDKWFVEECFDRLLAWNRWRFANRDCNGDGLLELASVPYYAHPEEYIGTKQAAMFESGIDNSPMWDRAVFNEERHCLELSYVGLNALMVVDCQFLAKMAALLGREDEKRELLQKAADLSEKIDRELWDEETGGYLNKHWSGEFDPCLSLTHFYTITAGIPDEERTKKLLGRLTDEKEFGGEYVIPNVARSDPAFPEQEYWRGRIWAPTNFLVAEGLMRIKEYGVWNEIIKKGLDQFIKCWDEKGIVAENYNAITGEAAEKGKASDKFYHWGALLVYMAVNRAVNFNEWEDKTEVMEIPDWLSKVENMPV